MMKDSAVVPGFWLALTEYWELKNLGSRWKYWDLDDLEKAVLKKVLWTIHVWFLDTSCILEPPWAT